MTPSSNHCPTGGCPVSFPKMDNAELHGTWVAEKASILVGLEILVDHGEQLWITSRGLAAIQLCHISCPRTRQQAICLCCFTSFCHPTEQLTGFGAGASSRSMKSISRSLKGICSTFKPWPRRARNALPKSVQWGTAPCPSPIWTQEVARNSREIVNVHLFNPTWEWESHLRMNLYIIKFIIYNLLASDWSAHHRPHSAPSLPPSLPRVLSLSLFPLSSQRVLRCSWGREIGLNQCFEAYWSFCKSSAKMVQTSRDLAPEVSLGCP